MSDYKNVLLILLSVLAGAVHAQETLVVETAVAKEEQVTQLNGEQTVRLVPAETVAPGEIVVYTIRFTNSGSEAADNVVITNPINSNLVYQSASTSLDSMQTSFSVDGGSSFAAAEDLTVVEDGESRPAMAADYTHVRWTLAGSLAASASGEASFRAILK